MITEKLILGDKIIQQPGNIVSDMDGEKVILNIENGKYYNLGEIGGYIWELIDKPISINDLVKKIIAEYEVNAEECERQILSFCSELYSEGLIKII